MAYGDRLNFRDERTGRFRRPQPYEKNRYFKVDTLSRGLANFMFKTQNGMAEIANEFADELLQYAQDHAPWQDQTGDARAGLQTAAVLRNESLEVELYHTVEYGIWLEVRWGGKYAIIIPSVEAMGTKLLQKMDGLIGEITYYD